MKIWFDTQKDRVAVSHRVYWRHQEEGDQTRPPEEGHPLWGVPPTAPQLQLLQPLPPWPLWKQGPDSFVCWEMYPLLDQISWSVALVPATIRSIEKLYIKTWSKNFRTASNHRDMPPNSQQKWNKKQNQESVIANICIISLNFRIIKRSVEILTSGVNLSAFSYMYSSACWSPETMAVSPGSEARTANCDWLCFSVRGFLRDTLALTLILATAFGLSSSFSFLSFKRRWQNHICSCLSERLSREDNSVRTVSDGYRSSVTHSIELENESLEQACV